MTQAKKPQPIPESHQDLFDKRALAHVATTMPNGSPQVTPVWVLLEDGYVVINSARGRQKDRNMEVRPQVAICIVDPENPYRHIAIRGRVVEATEDGAVDVINRLSAKYTGNPVYGGRRPGEVRVTYRIRPDHINVMG